MVLEVSVVVILDNTWLFQAFFTLSSKVFRDVPAGISLSTFLQACSDEMNDTPTLEVTCEVLKVKTAPSRAVDS